MEQKEAEALLKTMFDGKVTRRVATLARSLNERGDPFFMVGQWFPKIAVYECPLWPGCGFAPTASSRVTSSPRPARRPP